MAGVGTVVVKVELESSVLLTALRRQRTQFVLFACRCLDDPIVRSRARLIHCWTGNMV